MGVTSERANHWDDAYRRRGASSVSWFQAQPTVSVELIQMLGISPAAAVIDVGGGASSLVDHLLGRGFSDLTVLDISDVALEEGKRRVGAAAPVIWLCQDILSWQPKREFALWHDRAVFHFLTDQNDRETYLRTLRSTLSPDGAVIIATFASDGPEMCSGLPVSRYSGLDLGRLLGSGFEVVEKRREEHLTPNGSVQPFTWVAARRSA